MMHARQDGVTLIELLVTVAVTAILVAAATPSFSGMLARMRVDGAANELAGDLNYAASEAVSRNGSVALVSNTGGTGYSINFGATGLKTVTLASSLSVTASTAATFEPMRASSNAATFTLSSSATSSTLNVTTNAAGRVQICKPTGSTIGTYPSC